jgi:D-alanyl-D-alanine dipeptidase
MLLNKQHSCCRAAQAIEGPVSIAQDCTRQAAPAVAVSQDRKPLFNSMLVRTSCMQHNVTALHQATSTALKFTEFLKILAIYKPASASWSGSSTLHQTAAHAGHLLGSWWLLSETV